MNVEQIVSAIHSLNVNDLREVGDERAHLRGVLDATDEVRLCRMILDHEGGTLPAAVVDEHVDPIAQVRVGR